MNSKNIAKVPIFNIKINNVSKEDLLYQFHNGILVTPNVDHLVKLQKDKEFYKVYTESDWVICDSNIIQLGLKILGNPVKEVIPGSSFFPSYYNYHKYNMNVKIFLLGAAEGVAEEAMKRINANLGREIIVGAFSPTFGFEKNENECEEIINVINGSDATVLVLGVGAPKQEKWIFKYKDKFLKITTFMALGATIDFEAGNVKRAPKIFQDLHIEWLFRLLKEPKRLWRRYLVEDMFFFVYILKARLGFYKNPFG